MKRKDGVVTAFVHTVDAEHGRVIVEYRSIQEGLLSPWAPVAAPLSGKSRGALFMPEKGDEVLVGFHDGAFEHPYVLGFLWNGEQVSPETEASNRVIVTPGHHQLRFEDKENATRIVLKSAGEHSLTLEDQAKNSHVELTTKGRRYVLLDDTPNLGKVQIKSDQHQITLDDVPGGAKVEIKAGSALGVTITMATTPPSLTIQIGAGNTISVDPTGVTLTTPGILNVTAAGVANVTCATANLTASAATNLTTGVLNVNAGLANFSGVLRASAIQTQVVISPLYTPGLGNLI